MGHGSLDTPGLGNPYRVPAAPKLAVLCCFPALSLPSLLEGGDEQEEGGWPGCGAKRSLREGLRQPSHGHQPWKPRWRGDLLRISAVAYFGIMESVVSSGCRMQPCV